MRNFRTLSLVVCVFLLQMMVYGQRPPSLRRIIVLLGPPGAGKSTQANYVSKKYRIPAISMSSLLKKEVGAKSPLGKRLKVALASGALVNDDLMNELVMQRLAKPDTEPGFILDGYPASAGQAKFLDNLANERGFPPPLIVYLAVPDAVVLERMSKRRRADDQPAIMNQRLAEFHREVDPLLEYWKGMNVQTIDGTQKADVISGLIDQLLVKSNL